MIKAHLNRQDVSTIEALLKEGATKELIARHVMCKVEAIETYLKAKGIEVEEEQEDDDG